MKELFFMGGALFMSVLSLLFIGMLAWAAYHFIVAWGKNNEVLIRKRNQLKHVKSIGLFAMIFGISGQMIGIYSALSAIEKAKDISPSVMFAGFRISMITTLYGLSIFMISLLIWFFMDAYLNRKIK